MRFKRLLQFAHVVENMVTPRALRLLLRQFPHAPEPEYEPKKKSLLYVAASSLPHHISGYTVRTQSLLTAMQDAGLSVSVQTRPGYPWDRPDGLVNTESDKTDVEGIAYYHAYKPTRYRPIFAFALQGASVIADKAQEQRVAVVHAASNYANALPALFAARRLGVPFHYEMRGLWELTRASRQLGFEQSAGYRLGLALEGLLARHADRVYVISAALGEFAQEHWGLSPRKIRLLPNCIDPKAIVPVHADDIVEPMTIGYAGSLIGYEGLDTLLDALALLHQQGRLVRLRIVGDGEARFDLEDQMRSLGLTHAVQFLGRLPPEEARATLGCCALVCIPRKPYSVCKIVPPLKLVEALALGKAVVVPDLPVFRGELGEDAPALFFRSGDALDLAQVIATGLDDRALLYTLGQRARHYAVNHRNWSRFVASFVH